MRRYVIFTGGETQKKSAPGVSESKLMRDYVENRMLYHGGSFQRGISYFLEQNSFTTFDNIKLTAPMVENLLRNPVYADREVIIVNGYGCHLNTELKMYLDRLCEYLHITSVRPGITIFCESSQGLKVLLLAWYFLSGYRARLETISWELASPVKELCQTIYDFAAIFIPGLATYAHNKRVKGSYTK